MVKVESFTMDHTKVKAPFVRKCGLLTGEKGDKVSKFDLRFMQPNEAAIPTAALHALEHLLAGYLREEVDNVIDLSPMGCRTGFYFIVWGNVEPETIKIALINALKKVVNSTEVPAANAIQCGNYRDLSLHGAIEYAKEVFNDVIPSVFRNSKNYFDKLAVLNLDRYRPSLISKKKFATEINKIIFYRNLLNFNQTGIIPTFDGFVLGHADQYQDVENLKTQLRKIYSLGFDFEKFKTMQANIIFNPEDLNLVPQKIIAHRTCRKNNSKAMGIVLADKDENVFYLIHAYIEDELNPASTYEIQLNVLFDGNIENRVQLIRLDNWQTQQYHKNIANKLQTKTHTHFYNQFDLIRGKENGGFDISHNLENGAVTFDKAFVTFVKSLGLKLALQKDILKQFSKSNPSTGTGL